MGQKYSCLHMQRWRGRSHHPGRCCYACATSSHSCSRSGCSCTGLMTAAGGLPRSLKSTPSDIGLTCFTKQVCPCNMHVTGIQQAIIAAS